MHIKSYFDINLYFKTGQLDWAFELKNSWLIKICQSKIFIWHIYIQGLQQGITLRGRIHVHKLQITEPEFPKVKLSEQIDKFSLKCFLFITFLQTILQNEKERKNIIFIILWKVIVPVNL